MPSDFAELRSLIMEQGLMRHRPLVFFIHAFFSFVLLGVSVLILTVTDNFFIQMFNAILLAIAFGQIGFLGHDSGHCQAFKSQRMNSISGQVSGFFTGVSRKYWIEKHNAHHANPNHEDMDPDIDYVIAAFTEEQARGKKGISRFITRHQHHLFFPIIALSFLSLRLGSIRYFASNSLRKMWLDLTLFLAHFFVYCAVIFWLLPFWTAVAFIIVHQYLFGLYLGSVFAPNHKGMPVLSEEERKDFLREQVLTARNVRAHLLTDFWYGGLNYQIEHHLFPQMPRANLRRASTIVREFCNRRKISYHETGCIQSYREIIAFMRQIALSVQRSEA